MRVFLSYPRERVGEAREVQAFLEGFGLNVWRDHDQIVGGEAWRHEREEAQRAAEFIVHLYSTEMLGRAGEVHREIRQTLEQAQGQPLHSIYYVVVRLDDVPVPAELTDRQWIDYFGGEWRLPLSQSVRRKFEQLQRPTPDVLQNYIDTEQLANNIRPRRFSHNEINKQFLVEYVQYADNARYYEYVNSTIAAAALEEFFSTRADFELLENPGPERPFAWEIRTEEVFRRGEIISIRSWHYYDAGGVHPTYGATTKNFFGSRFGARDIKGVFDHNADVRDFLVQYINAELNRQINELEGGLQAIGDDRVELDIRGYWPQEEIDFNWPPALEAYNIQDRGLLFTLSEYVGLPHAFGVREVRVPWDLIRHYLGEVARNALREICG